MIKSTPELRARIRELSVSGRDDHDRAVLMLLDDLKSLTLILWQAWFELNAIRARDGVPYTHQGWRASVDEAYFRKVVDDCEKAIEKLTGEPPKPWPPR